MSMDFPRGWQIARATPMGEHEPECSFRQENGGILCDCKVITKHAEYSDEPLHTVDGKVFTKDAESEACAHRWVAKRMGGSPSDADSDEWVKYCDLCGEEYVGD